MNTIQEKDKKEIEQIINENKAWDSISKTLKYVTYSELYETFIVNIPNYYIKSNPDDKFNIYIYIQNNLNNWNGVLLNGHSKRNYTYISPTVFPNQLFEEIVDTEIIIKLFNKYYLKNEMITIDDTNDNFINNLHSIYDIKEKEIQKLSINIENFEKILEFHREGYQLKYINFTDDTEMENRLLYFMRKNDKLFNSDLLISLNQITEDPIIHVFDQLIQNFENKEQFIELLNDPSDDNLFIRIIELNDTIIQMISEFLNHNSDKLKPEQVKRFKHNYRRTLSTENFLILLKDFFYGKIDTRQTETQMRMKKFQNQNNNNNIDNYISFLFSSIGRLSNSNEVTGTIFHNYIPKNWKLSDTNRENLSEHIKKNEFLFHNDIFVKYDKYTNLGFNKYKQDKKYSYYFSGLYDFIRPYLKLSTTYLNGFEGSILLEDSIQDFKKFIFLFLIYKIIQYIEQLYDEGGIVTDKANLLFTSLEDEYQLNIEESIQICTEFLFDLLFNYYETYDDPEWIINNILVSEKISKQKEKEKQALIQTLENQTSDERIAKKNLQDMGATNWWQDREEANEVYQNSNERKSDLENERLDRRKELFYENDVELDLLERVGGNLDQVVPRDELEDEDENEQIDHDVPDDPNDYDNDNVDEKEYDNYNNDEMEN